MNSRPTSDSADVRQAPYRSLWAVGWPVLAAGLAQLVAGVVDVALMGWYSVEGLAAVAAGAAVYLLAVNTVSGAALGHQILAAKRTGAGDLPGVGSSLLHSAVFACSAATLLVAGLALGAQPLLGLFVGPAEVLQDAASYLRIRAPGLLFAVAIALLRAPFDADRDTRVGMRSSLLMNAVNLALSGALIHGPGPLPELGASGNALAGTAATACAAAYLLLVSGQRNVWERIRPRSWAVDARELRRTVELSWPPTASNALDYLATLVLFAFMGLLGTAELGAGRVVFNLMMVAFTVAASLAAGTRILAGRAWGAGRLDDIQLVRSNSLRLLGGLLGAAAVVLAAFPVPILRLYTDFDGVVAAGVPGVYVVAASLPLIAWTYANVGVLRAVERTRWDMYANVGPIWAVQVPTSYVAGVRLGMGLAGVFLGFVAYWAVRGAATQVMADSALRQRRRQPVEAR